MTRHNASRLAALPSLVGAGSPEIGHQALADGDDMPIARRDIVDRSPAIDALMLLPVTNTLLPASG
jgi:hypothetical protein